MWGCWQGGWEGLSLLKEEKVSAMKFSGSEFELGCEKGPCLSLSLAQSHFTGTISKSIHGLNFLINNDFTWYRLNTTIHLLILPSHLPNFPLPPTELTVVSFLSVFLDYFCGYSNSNTNMFLFLHFWHYFPSVFHFKILEECPFFSVHSASLYN